MSDTDYGFEEWVSDFYDIHVALCSDDKIADLRREYAAFKKQRPVDRAAQERKDKIKQAKARKAAKLEKRNKIANDQALMMAFHNESRRYEDLSIAARSKLWAEYKADVYRKYPV